MEVQCFFEICLLCSQYSRYRTAVFSTEGVYNLQKSNLSGLYFYNMK